ncbi:ABC transporter ATP-binding protein/permease [Micrococcus sp. M4NT]|uniref:ABC transporter ATP-binding protein/permease n=1 Tax=Micrococcus sp. M4NT TaxID=2957501 RepID=UPI0029AA0A09|nr:ABC transporter ATP-binding protein/permease [Micrococcus sp. M4NT]MDX2340072.1 ABC transporter ATP-binding protein/permease [Micrococcus sp. M4NT]
MTAASGPVAATDRDPEPAPTPTAALLELRGVGKHFAGADRPALDGADLTVREGDFIAIVGPSGSGKSTLLNVLGLLDRPDTGSYLVDGKDTTAMGEGERDRLRSRMFGFVFQSSHVLGDEAVGTNAALGLRIQHVPWDERDERAGEALDLLGLGHRLDTRAKLLSGGERQRLAIARAVATRPRVILADEPTGNLDSANSRIVIDHLRELHARGTTVLLITHDPEIAAQADRQVVIDDGMLTEPRPSAPRALAADATGATVVPGATAASSASPSGRRASPLLDDTVDALSSLSSRFLRTVLLMAAFAVGIGGLVAAVGLTQTATAQVSARLTAAALDEVVVNLPADDGLLDPDDDRLTRWGAGLAALPHVRAAGHLAQISPADVRITRSTPDEPEPSAALTLASASSSAAAATDLRFPAGAEALLDSSTERLAWVTPDAARALQLPVPESGILSPGYRIWVAGQSVPVVGLVQVSDRTPQLGAAVFVTRPLMAGMRRPELTLTVRTETGFPYPVAQAAPLVIAPENPGSVTTRTVADLRNLRAGVSDDLGAFVGVLSAVLLALAVISASTAMYLSVQSRTAEIALRRAIGSGRALIARLFLLEGALIGLAGGAVGAALGSAVILAVAQSRGWAAVLPSAAVPLSLALGLAAGVVSALYPAWVASRQRPADALRG